MESLMNDPQKQKQMQAAAAASLAYWLGRIKAAAALEYMRRAAELRK